MAVPVTTRQDVEDKNGRPVHVGSKVRLEGIPGPVDVHQVDPRYGLVVVIVPGRAGQSMGRMVRSSEVELV
jgi:hypothetical protein